MTVVLDPNDVLTIYEGCYEDLECGGTVMLIESLPQNTSYSFSYKCSNGTQPAVIDSNGEYCTTISGANTLDSTCQYSPTPQPTSNDPFQLVVVQTITNCPYSYYLNQQKKYDKTFKESIVASLQSSISITIDDILNFQVQDATTRRKLLQTTPALTISYTLQSSSVSATTLSSALTQAISSGTFDQQLNTIAANNGATGLTTASSSAPSITNNSPTLAPTFPPTFSPTAVKPTSTATGKHPPVAAIVGALVAVFIVGVCAFLLYRHYLKKQVKASVEVDSNTNNPLTHRITVVTKETDSKMPVTKVVNETEMNNTRAKGV